MPSISLPGMIYGAAQAWNAKDDRSAEEIDSLVSILEFGDRKQKIVGFMRELSRLDRIIFNDIVFFRDFKVYNLPYYDFGTCLYEESKKRILETNQEDLSLSVRRCEEILREMTKIYGGAPEAKADTFRELYLSVRGVALMQEFAMAVKKFEYGQDVQLLEPPRVLAAKLEYWLSDYCEAWRAVSRESELFRIREFFFQICLILRKYNVE
jgi:hypothetical protein